LAFSTASGLLAFWMDTAKDLDLAQQVPPETLAYWVAMKDFSFYSMIFAAAVGVLFVIFGAFKIKRIIDTTKFD
jgi:hypothetical protein